MPLLIPGNSVCLGVEWSLPEQGCFPHKDLKCSYQTSSLSLSLGFSRGHEDMVVLSHSLQQGAAQTAEEAKATHRLLYAGSSRAASHVSRFRPTITQPFLHWLVCHLNTFILSLHGHQCHQTLQAVWGSLSFTISGTAFRSLASIQAQQRHSLIVP